MDSTDPPVDPLLLGEWLARYRYRLKYGSNNQLEAINKLRAILGLEADDEDVYQKAELCMERLALSFSKKVEGFVITPAHVEHLFTVQPGQTKAAISEEDFMANFCTPVYWDSKVPEDMLPVMKRLYFHETGLDVDDPDGYAYGTSTFHFNNYIASLVKKIDKSFGWFPYSGFGKLSREMRDQLRSWLQQQKKDKDDQQKLESLKEAEEPEDQLKRKNMFEDDSSEEESKKTPAADSSDEDGPAKKKQKCGRAKRAAKAAKTAEGGNMPHALCQLLPAFGVDVSEEEVCSILPSASSHFTSADEFVQKYGLELARVTGRFMVKGGPELALLNAKGNFVVQLSITDDKNGKKDLHCVAYDGETLCDKVIDDSHRASTENARKLIDSLREGRIANVYELRRNEKQAEKATDEDTEG